MQVLENWDPLKLPRGSIRALITLTLVGVLWTLMLLGRETPLALSGVALIALGHYFGFRGSAPPEGKPPLFLPRGSIRTILILGFGIVAYFLVRDEKLQASLRDRNFTILVLAAALVAGFVVRKIADLVTRGRAIQARRWFENGKSVVAIVATGAFALACILVDNEVPQRDNILLFAAPVIALYFGSRD